MPRAAAGSVNRRTDIISAAIEVFAETGYYRATTAQVAERAEISQPYVFKFFSTKEALLVEALEVSWIRVLDAFRSVIVKANADRLEQELIESYQAIMDSHRNEVLLQMQAHTIQEESVIKVMQKGFLDVQHMVLEAFQQAGLHNPQERTLMFLARGMLCNISMSLSLPQLMSTEQ